MNQFLLKALRNTLRKLARLVVWRYRPAIIGVTGSVGKTSTRRAIGAVLRVDRSVRETAGNLNNELGLPLTVLGDWDKEDLALVSHGGPEGEKLRKAWFWAKVILKGAWLAISPMREKYPEILVLEYGADKPGDIRRLLAIVRPNLGVITAVGDIPVHVEFYSGPDEVAREKARIIEWLPTASYAILNYDDESVMNLEDRTRAKVMTFGFGKDANVRIGGFEHRMEGERPAGIAFRLEYGGRQIPIRIDNAYGRVQAYASAAAACIGLAFGMNMIRVAEALKEYHVAEGRANVFPGIKGTYVINDSYNASPLSTHAALDTLRGLGGKRKVAILGDMKELGQYSVIAHERIGEIVATVADVLVTIGPHAKFIADSARKLKFPKTKLFSFDSADEAMETILGLIKKGDLILVKASHSVGLDKVAEALREK